MCSQHASSSATIAARTAAAATSVTYRTAVARQSSASSASSAGEAATTTTIAAHRSVPLEGAVFDCEKTIDKNRATCAQAAASTAVTPITALDVEAFDVNVSEREISCARGKSRVVDRADCKQPRVAGAKSHVHPS